MNGQKCNFDLCLQAATSASTAAAAHKNLSKLNASVSLSDVVKCLSPDSHRTFLISHSSDLVVFVTQHIFAYQTDWWFREFSSFVTQTSQVAANASAPWWGAEGFEQGQGQACVHWELCACEHGSGCWRAGALMHVSACDIIGSYEIMCMWAQF